MKEKIAEFEKFQVALQGMAREEAWDPLQELPGPCSGV